MQSMFLTKTRTPSFPARHATKRAAVNDRYNIPNVEKAMRVLEYLAGYPEGRTLRELVEGLDIPKTGFMNLRSIELQPLE